MTFGESMDLFYVVGFFLSGILIVMLVYILYLFEYYRKPNPIDPQLLQSMKVYQNIGYVPNPGKSLRNQIAYKLPKEGPPSQTRKPSVPESPLGRGLYINYFFFETFIYSNY